MSPDTASSGDTLHLPTANLGSSLGTAVAGTILVTELTSNGYATAMIALAVFGVIGLAAALLLPHEGTPAPAAGDTPAPGATADAP
ncbi:hypothetical protein [Kitasatospora mediocidica]|uniref:hypothetical protein n=1 Tax=Kitasatospora mediocidica TaxID=58352 RepID=UPI00055ED5B3|nr:hypothetical protein [Kitasatospora mediocidica]